MCSDSVITVRNLCKNYAIYEKPSDRLKQMIFLGKIKFYKEFIALRDLNFSIQKGTAVGILGRNGAGKSTLLQIICGTTQPTSGHVEIKGKIGALLELGSGFNPEFTGRDNIYLNASILGMTRQEIESKYKDIVNFADIGDFINQPVKTYSSGMYVRLAFAVAVHVNPDILIIDEALSVGDIKFQAKCFRKFEEFRKAGKTILFVTHSPELIVRHCSRALLLDKGCLIEDGDPKTVVNRYMDLLFGQDVISGDRHENLQVNHPAQNKENDSSLSVQVKEFLNSKFKDDILYQRLGYNKYEYRWGNKQALIVDCLCCTEFTENVNNCLADDTLTIYLKCFFLKDVLFPIYAVTIKTHDGVTVYGTNSRDFKGGPVFQARKKGEVVVVKFTVRPALVTGHYFLSFGLVEQQGEDVIPLDRRYDVIELIVINEKKCFGIADLDMTFEMVA